MPGTDRPRSTTVIHAPEALTFCTGPVSGSDSNGSTTSASMLRVATISSMSFTCLPGSDAVASTKSSSG